MSNYLSVQWFHNSATRLQQLLEQFEPITKQGEVKKTKQIENHFPAGGSDDNIHCFNKIQTGLCLPSHSVHVVQPFMWYQKLPAGVIKVMTWLQAKVGIETTSLFALCCHVRQVAGVLAAYRFVWSLHAELSACQSVLCWGRLIAEVVIKPRPLLISSAAERLAGLKILQDFTTEIHLPDFTAQRAMCAALSRCMFNRLISGGKPSAQLVSFPRRDLHRCDVVLPLRSHEARGVRISCPLCQSLSALTHSTRPQKIS